jgi:hypothetical protein
MLRDLLNYLRTLLSNSWFRGFFFLSLVSTATTFYASFHPGFLLPKDALVVVALVALLISPYDLYKRQEERIHALLRENAELTDTQDKRLATALRDLISELEDNLRKAANPVSDRFFGGGSYVRPSTDCWKAVRNVLPLDGQLRLALNRVYDQVDRWSSIVDSGLKPGIGSQELNGIAALICAEVPVLLRELRKAQLA